jgi:DNA repair protein RadC
MVNFLARSDNLRIDKVEKGNRIIVNKNSKVPCLFMRIKDLPDSSKPRERFLKMGAGALSEAELLAIILRTGCKGENVVEMCNRLIKEHGLDKLFDCSLTELQEIKGIGPSKAMQILSISEIGKRHSELKGR